MKKINYSKFETKKKKRWNKQKGKEKKRKQLHKWPKRMENSSKI